MVNIQNQNTNITLNTSEENVMSSTDNLVSALTAHFSSNPSNFTNYRKEIDALLRQHIKPISSRSGKTGNGGDWRSELKSKFSGRGAKWVFVSLENIESRLSELELEGIDCSDYRKNITKSGKAWIRFSGARINNDVKCAAFEVRTEGSTIDHPKQLHLIYVDGLDDVIETMPGTPKSLKLEEDSAPMPNIKKVSKPKKVEVVKTKETSELDSLAEEINVELNETPQSEDPADWEAFLAAEGLTCFDEELDEL